MVHKFIDFASPTLFIKCCTGTHIKEARSRCAKRRDKPVEFLKLKLTTAHRMLMKGSSPSQRLGKAASQLARE